MKQVYIHVLVALHTHGLQYQPIESGWEVRLHATCDLQLESDLLELPTPVM